MGQIIPIAKDRIMPITADGHNPAFQSVPEVRVLDEATVLSGSGQNQAICFGPFCLLAAQRLLLKSDRAVRLGSRALDILIALIERRGEEVSRNELMAKVWPKTNVDPSNLTANIFTLRRALGDAQAGDRYIINIPGRGYRFVSPVTFHAALGSPAPWHSTLAHRPKLRRRICPISAENQNPALQPLVVAGAPDEVGFPDESDRDCAICFGPFRLFATKRLLLKNDRAVRLGSRALDILIVLIERAGKLVANCELREIVWPDTFVVEANLTVNIAALRRALGDGQADNRYIVNISGRGYCFVAPVTFHDAGRVPSLRHSKMTRQKILPAGLDRTGVVAKPVPPTLQILRIVENRDGGKTVVLLAAAKEPIPAYEHGRKTSGRPSVGTKTEAGDGAAAPTRYTKSYLHRGAK
jgi:DNA-binding winged helix-turn-helix (wHTH) protein